MKRALTIIARSLFLLIALALFAFALLAWQVDRLGRRDAARPADAIVVLGARVLTDGRPGPDLTSRAQHGIGLWRQGYAPYLICTGGFRDEPLSAAAVCRRVAIEAGVPAERIFLADGATNTAEDAASTAQVMAAHNLRDAIIVSHPLHLYRAAWLFRRAGLAVVTSPTPDELSAMSASARLWITGREAGAVLVTALHGWNLMPGAWEARLQRWVYRQQ